MLRFVVLTSLVATALAGGYGGSSYGSSSLGLSSMGSFGGSLGLSSSSLMGSSLDLSSSMGSSSSMLGSSSSGYSGGLIPGAIQSRRTVQFLDMPSTMAAPIPLAIEMPASSQPIAFLMKARSSPLALESTFESSPGSYQESSSMDEPQVRVHTVTRPLLQKINEIISPYRQIRQEIQPLQEQVNTLVTRGSGYTAGTGYASTGSLMGSSSLLGLSKLGYARPSYGGPIFGAKTGYAMMPAMAKPLAQY